MLRGFKGSVWEGGHRVPAIAYWPGRIKPNTATDQQAISLDVFPTLLELGRAMRSGGWKLVIRGKGRKNQQAAQLFDLSQDPSEANNLAKAERRRVNEMREKLRVWESEVGIASGANK